MSPLELQSELPARQHHLPAAGATVVAVALLAGLPLALDDSGRLIAVLIVQLSLVAAWVLATGIRGFRGSLGIGAGAAVGADLLVVLPDRPRLDGLLVVLGLAFLAVVGHQMVRAAPRRYLVASLSGVVVLVCLVCALAVLLPLGDSADGAGPGRTAVLAVGAAVVAGHLVDLLLPRPQLADGVPRGLPGVIVAVLAATVVSLFGRDGGGTAVALSASGSGAALGAVAALIGLGTSYVAVERARAGWALPVVQAVLPIAACAPVAYFLSLAIPS